MHLVLGLPLVCISISAHGQNAEAYLSRGNVCLDKREYDKAIADFNEALRLDPRNARAYCGRGWAWNQKKEYDKAIADFNESLQLNPRFAMAYNNRGIAWKCKCEYDNAIGDYNEALRLDPKFAMAYNNRGIAWRLKAEYGKAIADFGEAVRIDPRNAGAYCGRGWTWYLKKEYDKAIADYNESLRLDPRFALAYDNRGNACLDKGEYDNAIADFSEALRLDPMNAGSYCGRGWAWNRKKEYDKAIADFNEALRLNPMFAMAYDNRGNTWRLKGEYDRSMADFNEALRLNPMFAMAYDNRGWTWIREKQYNQAIADFNEALRLAPDCSDYYYDRGCAWNRKGESAKATADYNTASRLDARFDPAQYAVGEKIVGWENFIRYYPRDERCKQTFEAIVNIASTRDEYEHNLVCADLWDIESAQFNDQTGELILIGPRVGDQQLGCLPPLLVVEDLAMALRIIDAGKEEDLGVSIGTYNYGAAPGQEEKDRILGRMNVEYMPKMTAGTHMGFVLFEADRWLKGLSHGRDNETGSRLSVRVPGYLTQPQCAYDYFRRTAQFTAQTHLQGERPYGLNWFLPDPPGVESDGYSMKFVSYRMNVKYRAETPDPAIGAFADHMTANFAAYCREFPVFQELVRMHKLVQVAKWYRACGFPDDKLLAHERLRIPTPRIRDG